MHTIIAKPSPRLCLAVLLCLASLMSRPTHAVCVSDIAGLRGALNTAASNGQNDTIKLVRGVYHTGGTQLAFNSNETFSLSVIGGYAPGCATRLFNAALTVLDGDNAALVFSSESTGDVALHFVTVQHGLASGIAGAALRMNFFSSSTGSLVVDQTIIRSNHAGSAAFSLATYGSATLEFANNLVIDNLADTWVGGPEIYCAGGAVNIINSTFANNTVNSTDPRTIGGLVLYGPNTALVTLSNNIFWGNTASDLTSANGVMIDNDYGINSHAPVAGSSGNHSFDPQFSSRGDFHLLSTSPLLGIGTLTPVGGLTTYDLDGNPRTWNNAVDLGPYERGNEIFGDGFDS